jgi:tRNA threonylcarbamoyladenosine biosynthesis protein TsaB
VTVLLAFDTATPATVVGVLAGRGHPVAQRHDPAPGERPRHAGLLLPLARAALERAGAGFADVGRLGVGVGPGTFTGLRIGVATARALALAGGAAVVPVPTLRALAEGAGHDGPVLAVLDARRGEAFAAAYAPQGGAPALLLGPVAVAPEGLAALVAGAPGPWMAVGDGAVRFRSCLEAAAVAVPPDDSPLHDVSAPAICRLARDGHPVAVGALVPEYVRAPDAAERARPRAAGAGG